MSSGHLQVSIWNQGGMYTEDSFFLPTEKISIPQHTRKNELEEVGVLLACSYTLVRISFLRKWAL